MIVLGEIEGRRLDDLGRDPAISPPRQAAAGNASRLALAGRLLRLGEGIDSRSVTGAPGFIALAASPWVGSCPSKNTRSSSSLLTLAGRRPPAQPRWVPVFPEQTSCRVRGSAWGPRQHSPPCVSQTARSSFRNIRSDPPETSPCRTSPPPFPRGTLRRQRPARDEIGSRRW